MEKLLIPIGKMAQINNTTIATLRLYDSKNLLKPKYIDKETGYRYYDIQQNSRLDMIAYMKELGMSLQEIKTILESKDISRIENILSKKNEQIHSQIDELKLKHDSIERTINIIEYYRKAPSKGIIILQYIDRRYIWKTKCKNNFYDGNISDYENCLSDLRSELIENNFTQIHTFNVGTSIDINNYKKLHFLADEIFIFVGNHLYKNRNDIEVIDSGIYACCYTDNYDDEIECAKKLKDFCDENNYIISGNYICEILAEFNVFDDHQRNMFLRLQVPISFNK